MGTVLPRFLMRIRFAILTLAALAWAATATAQVSPSELTSSLEIGAMETQTLTLTNPTGEAADFRVETRRTVPPGASAGRGAAPSRGERERRTTPYGERPREARAVARGPLPGGSPALFGVDITAEQIVRIDPSTGDEQGRIDIPGFSGDLGTAALAYDGETLFLSNGAWQGATTILAIGLDGQLLRSLTLADGPAGGIVGLAHDGLRLYAIGPENGVVHLLDDATGAAERTLDLGVFGSDVSGLAFAGDRGTLLYASDNGPLVEFDPETGEILRAIPLDGDLLMDGVGYSSGLGLAFVGEFYDTAAYDLDTGAEQYRFAASSISGLAGDEAIGLDWLAVSPDEGTLGANESVALTVTFDATDLGEGTYTAEIDVFLGESETPFATVPVTLSVSGVPEIVIAPESLVLPGVFVGQTVTGTFAVSNAGTGTLTITSISADSPNLTISPDAFALAPGASQEVTVSLTPGASGAVIYRVTVESDDPDTPSVAVEVSNVAQEPPVASVTPASLELTVASGETVEAGLTLNNAGESPLAFAASASDGGVVLFGVNEATGTIDRLDPQTGDVLASFDVSPYTSRVGSAGLAYDGTALYVYDSINEGARGLHVLDPETGALVSEIPLQGNPSVDGLAFLGGDLYALNYKVATISRVDLATGALTLVARVDQGVFGGLAAVPENGTLLAALPGGSSLVEIDPATGETVRVVNVDFGFSPYGLSYDPEEGVVFAGRPGTPIAVVSYPEGERVRTLDARDHSGLAGDGQGGPSFLTVSPGAGTVDPSETTELTVTADATNLFAGVYENEVAIVTNDPASPRLTVPVTLTVTGEPVLEVPREPIEFPQVFVGYPATGSFRISNTGTAVLTVSALTASEDEIRVLTDAPFEIAPGESALVAFEILATEAGGIFGGIDIESDFSGGLRSVGISAQAFVPPTASVEPGEITVETPRDVAVMRTLTLANAGGVRLSYDVQIGGGRSAREASAPVEAPASSVAPHERRPASPILRRGGDAPEALVVIEFTPWGFDLPSYLADAYGLSVTTIFASELASTDLAAYDLLVTVGDQSFTYYDEISGAAAQIEAFARAGNPVLYLLGTQGADVDLAGGAALVFGTHETNTVALPGHPLVAGVSGTTLNGNDASHGSFAAWPEGAEAVAVDPNGVPTLGTYRLGAGRVVATGMPLEFYATRPDESDFTIILDNAIAAAVDGAGIAWLSVSPEAGTVSPGGSEDLTVTVDPEGLEIGTYTATIRILSDDPARPVLEVPVTLMANAGTPTEAAPRVLDLRLAGPNPARGAFTVELALPDASEIALDLFDARGRRVASLAKGPRAAGRHLVVAGGDLPAGVYVLRLTAGTETQTRTLTLVR